MTTQRLRDLLDERVADIDVPDLAGPAWERADGVRRRRRTVAVGVAALAMVAVAGTVAVVDQRDSIERSPSGRPTSTPPTPEPAPETPRATLAGEFRGAPFWWAPPAALDGDLPVLQVPGLPEELSMGTAPYADNPPDHVDAVFGMGKQQYLLFSDEQLVSVDLSGRLGPVADEGGNEFSPLGDGSVSPDGTRVFFRQPDGLEVWSLATNSWDSVPMSLDDVERSVWTLDGHVGLARSSGRPDPWDRGDHQWTFPVAGPDATAAELDWMAEGVSAPTANEPGQYANPEFLAAGTPDAPELLAFGDGRSKMCCVPMAWFSHDFVLFSASAPDGAYRVLAWRVGTPDLYRVSEYVDLPPRNFSASWAENAFQ